MENRVINNVSQRLKDEAGVGKTLFKKNNVSFQRTDKKTRDMSVEGISSMTVINPSSGLIIGHAIITDPYAIENIDDKGAKTYTPADVEIGVTKTGSNTVTSDSDFEYITFESSNENIIEIKDNSPKSLQTWLFLELCNRNTNSVLVKKGLIEKPVHGGITFERVEKIKGATDLKEFRELRLKAFNMFADAKVTIDQKIAFAKLNAPLLNGVNELSEELLLDNAISTLIETRPQEFIDRWQDIKNTYLIMVKDAKKEGLVFFKKPSWLIKETNKHICSIIGDDDADGYLANFLGTKEGISFREYIQSKLENIKQEKLELAETHK